MKSSLDNRCKCMKKYYIKHSRKIDLKTTLVSIAY